MLTSAEGDARWSGCRSVCPHSGPEMSRDAQSTRHICLGASAGPHGGRGLGRPFAIDAVGGRGARARRAPHGAARPGSSIQTPGKRKKRHEARHRRAAFSRRRARRGAGGRGGGHATRGEAFEKKDDISEAVQRKLETEMTTYGFQIHKAMRGSVVGSCLFDAHQS